MAPTTTTSLGRTRYSPPPELLAILLAHPMGTDSPESFRKAQIDAVLLKLHGVVAKKINRLDAYFVNDRMFACISGEGIGLRPPLAPPTNPPVSRGGGGPAPPGGAPVAGEGIHTGRAGAPEYEKALALSQPSIPFVKGAR